MFTQRLYHTSWFKRDGFENNAYHFPDVLPYNSLTWFMPPFVPLLSFLKGGECDRHFYWLIFYFSQILKSDWRTVDLQYCVNFFCWQSDSVTCIYSYSCSFPLWFIVFFFFFNFSMVQSPQNITVTDVHLFFTHRCKWSVAFILLCIFPCFL